MCVCVCKQISSMYKRVNINYIYWQESHRKTMKEMINECFSEIYWKISQNLVHLFNYTWFYILLSYFDWSKYPQLCSAIVINLLLNYY